MGTSLLVDWSLFLCVTELLVCDIQTYNFTSCHFFSYLNKLIILSLESTFDKFLIIIGFIKFLGPYYMLLIIKRRKIGMIGDHAVYAIAKSEMVRIPNSTVEFDKAYSKNENRSFVHSVCNHKRKKKLYLALLRQYLLELEMLYFPVSWSIFCLSM